MGVLANRRNQIYRQRMKNPLKRGSCSSGLLACGAATAEEASQGVQRGGNEHPLQEPAQAANLVA